MKTIGEVIPKKLSCCQSRKYTNCVLEGYCTGGIPGKHDLLLSGRE